LFDLLGASVDQSFYDPHFHGIDRRAPRARDRKRLAEVADDDQFEKLASAMLDELHASLTDLQPPSNVALTVCSPPADCR
jgi:hypothetical protein